MQLYVQSRCLPEPRSVIGIHQSVSKDSGSLMQPQSDQLIWRCSGFGVSTHHPLNDPGNISEIESVVRLQWCGQQLRAYLIVDVNGAFHNC